MVFLLRSAQFLEGAVYLGKDCLRSLKWYYVDTHNGRSSKTEIHWQVPVEIDG